MTILPLDPAANRNPAALRDFLAQCQLAAVRAGHAQLVSISLEVEALDPLAVLESIFEPGERHFYVERPAEGFALAGAEAVLSFEASGPDRFAACQRWIDGVLEHTIAVGKVGAPFAGPHFFSAFTFLDSGERDAPFAPASVFVPRWQVALREGRTVAVANLLVEAATPIAVVAEKVWRAHAKFGAFAYAEPEFTEPAARPAAVREVGGADHYAAAVGAALARIASGAYHKIVLARAKDLEAEGTFHPLRVLNGLRQRFSECYAFSVANGAGQSFIGASPERLLRVREGVLLTEALAGSIRRGHSASEDGAFASALQRDEKELREHRLVVESIVRRLASLGLAAQYPERPSVRRLANVQHLHTALQLTLPEGVRLLDVAARLHPTPAVGGSPREAAVPEIAGLEGFSRGLYAGALGWIDARGGGELFVGLRSALINGSRARIFAGAGIVRGSDPAKELAETELKFRAMQEALLS